MLADITQANPQSARDIVGIDKHIRCAERNLRVGAGGHQNARLLEGFACTEHPHICFEIIPVAERIGLQPTGTRSGRVGKGAAALPGDNADGLSESLPKFQKQVSASNAGGEQEKIYLVDVLGHLFINPLLHLKPVAALHIDRLQDVDALGRVFCNVTPELLEQFLRHHHIVVVFQLFALSEAAGAFKCVLMNEGDKNRADVQLDVS